MKWVPNSIAKRVAESDLAGEIVDANDTEFQVGDQVFGIIHPFQALSHGQGSLTTYAVAEATNLVHRPSNVTAVEAAGLSVTGLTAYQALFNAAKLESGQTIFINGGSTTVGAYAIQMAKSRGCHVVASASGKNEEYVRQLGADEVGLALNIPLLISNVFPKFVDYTTAPLDEQLTKLAPNPKFHVFFDAVGLAKPDLFLNCEGFLAPGGTFVTVGMKPSGVGSAFGLLWHLMLRPRWAGGAPTTLKYVSSSVLMPSVLLMSF